MCDLTLNMFRKIKAGFIVIQTIFAELSSMISGLSYLVSVSPFKRRISALRELGLPNPPVRTRWGAVVRYAAQLVGVWTEVRECVSAFHSSSPRVASLLASMANDGIALAQARWLLRIAPLPLMIIRNCESNPVSPFVLYLLKRTEEIELDTDLPSSEERFVEQIRVISMRIRSRFAECVEQVLPVPKERAHFSLRCASSIPRPIHRILTSYLAVLKLIATNGADIKKALREMSL
jgi:hypothetical protein